MNLSLLQNLNYLSLFFTKAKIRAGFQRDDFRFYALRDIINAAFNVWFVGGPDSVQAVALMFRRRA